MCVFLANFYEVHNVHSIIVICYALLLFFFFEHFNTSAYAFYYDTII